MNDPAPQGNRAQDRLIRRSDMVACKLAFIDCKLPGSTLKENYSIIGAGVTQSDDQIVNLPEPHGFAIGAAAMPNGVTNNLHIHYTAEVFMIFRGRWLFRWGVDGKDGEIVGEEGDVVSVPTWMFRGFTNIGPDDGWIYTALGRDETGGVIWDPKILRGAAEHGLYLDRENMLIDTSTGMVKPVDDELMRPLTLEHMALLRCPTFEAMRGRVTTADERAWSSRALLGSVLPGHAASLAPVIGWGMSEDWRAEPKVTNPHGFSVEWLRIEPGQAVGPFRIRAKQVLILKSGQLEVELGGAEDAGRAVLEPWDVFATPGGAWRTLRAGPDAPAEIAVVTAGDGRAAIEWAPEIVAAARGAGYGLDPNGYIAPAELLPYTPPQAVG